MRIQSRRGNVPLADDRERVSGRATSIQGRKLQRMKADLVPEDVTRGGFPVFEARPEKQQHGWFV